MGLKALIKKIAKIEDAPKPYMLLPKAAAAALTLLGRSPIFDAIAKAQAIDGLTGNQRRKQAVIYLQKYATRNCGGPVEWSVANLLIELFYQQSKTEDFSLVPVMYGECPQYGHI